MRALSVRQPYAEMILRGIKTVEYRTRPTRIIGERFHIYASKRPAPADGAGGVWSRGLAMSGATPGDAPPAWMLELAELLILKKLPTGVIVGSAVVERVTSGADGLFEWHLAEVERLARPIKPTRHPQPAWFRPFAVG